MNKPTFKRVEAIEDGDFVFMPWLREDGPNPLDDTDKIGDIMAALNILQLRRTSHISVKSLIISLTALVNTLPPPVKDKIGLDLGSYKEHGEYFGAYIGQHGFFSSTDEEFKAATDWIQHESDLDNKFSSSNKEYVIWIVNAGDTITYAPMPHLPGMPGTPDEIKRQHYVTIVMHFEPSDPVNNPSVLNRVAQLAIVDPLYQDHGDQEKAKKFRDRISHRLRVLLDSVTFAPDCERELWIPPLTPDVVQENFATPFMAYSVAAQLFDRIGATVCSGSDFDADTFFAPTRPWFDPDRVRTEMWGLLAAKAMEQVNWKVRIGLFPIIYFMDQQAAEHGSPASLRLWREKSVGFNWKDFVVSPATTKSKGQAAKEAEPVGKTDDNGQHDEKHVSSNYGVGKEDQGTDTAGKDIDDLFGDGDVTAPDDKMDIDNTGNDVPTSTKGTETQVDENPTSQAAGTQTEPTLSKKDTSTQTDTIEESKPHKTELKGEDVGTQTDGLAKKEEESDGATGDNNNNNNSNNNNSDNGGGNKAGTPPSAPQQETNDQQRRLDQYQNLKREEITWAQQGVKEARNVLQQTMSEANRLDKKRRTGPGPNGEPLEPPAGADLDLLESAIQNTADVIAQTEADVHRIRDIYDFDLHVAVAGELSLEFTFLTEQGILGELRRDLAFLQRVLMLMQSEYAESRMGVVYAGKKDEGSSEKNKNKNKNKKAGAGAKTGTKHKLDWGSDNGSTGTEGESDYDPNEILVLKLPKTHT
ncbi:hypothetical protein F5X99DRAFT_401965 [Biscogniauxia marginata]|nr:hypothetical protein F5X99DRAFT_401965 [Biscogniauxia marginata]